MSALIPKTRAQQRLEWLESLDRPLTEDESDMLRRSLHAVDTYGPYSKSGNHSYKIAQARNEELRTLAKVEAEMQKPEWYPHEL